MNAIDPGAGYRLLKEGEEIREGDEFDTHNGWAKAGTICGKPRVGGLVHYRRKIESGWIRIADQRPTEFPCLLWDGHERYVGTKVTQGWEVVRMNAGYTFFEDKAVTHWRPLELAAPPEPEKPVDELSALKAELENCHQQDRMKTAEINILTPENRALKAKIEKAKSLLRGDLVFTLEKALKALEEP